MKCPPWWYIEAFFMSIFLIVRHGAQGALDMLNKRNYELRMDIWRMKREAKTGPVLCPVCNELEVYKVGNISSCKDCGWEVHH